MYPSDLNTYNPPSSGGGGVTTYSVTLPTDVANGKLSVSPKNAAKGSTVTLTVTPDEGYQLATLTVTDKNGKTVELTKKSDTQYTFKMPASNVSIKATFAPVETPPATLPFTDVDGHWALDAITYVYEKGMMNGTSPTTFSPESQLTRGMIVTILYRLEDEPAVSDSTFSDVDGDMYYADPIAWAADNGIVTGFPDGTFGPETSITREQLATILYRYADYLDCDMTPAADLSGYTDAGTISSYAQQAMAWANAEGLITGVTETTLKPTGTATRAQVATILMRFCENVIK
ncbi:MAG TPA: S-layer homology domain-containing protein [Candidatus Evtepia faecigallinarum]|nr:S-layer homology domain-containing protein [Candidatus Evtepia faecigallinarum]